jgi:demethylmenaquinone methyltransferase/2-methoxy-6-polyprenyl-1,4-benzoquinol methylase
VSGAGGSQLDELLSEQIAYYRARAPEYGSTSLIDLPHEAVEETWRQMLAELDRLAPLGDTLELACGPGTFTGELARRATTVTALDASPEMLALAAASAPGSNVSFGQDDLFRWRPDRRFAFVFFGFWLSHVPLERFEAFWASVADALEPGGRVCFIDDAYRTAEELIEGEDSSTIERRLTDGRAFRAVKVPHTPASLERRLSTLGWRIAVRPLPGPFFFGSGVRA